MQSLKFKAAGCNCNLQMTQKYKKKKNYTPIPVFEFKRLGAKKMASIAEIKNDPKI
jgi:hypothetical protein